MEHWCPSQILLYYSVLGPSPWIGAILIQSGSFLLGLIFLETLTQTHSEEACVYGNSEDWLSCFPSLHPFPPSPPAFSLCLLFSFILSVSFLILSVRFHPFLLIPTLPPLSELQKSSILSHPVCCDLLTAYVQYSLSNEWLSCSFNIWLKVECHLLSNIYYFSY